MPPPTYSKSALAQPALAKPPRRLIPRQTTSYILLGSLLLALGLLLLYPIALTVRGAFAEDVATGEGFTLQHILITFEDPALVKGLLNALKVATLTTTLCLIISLPLAALAARTKFPGKGVFSALILTPLILPPFVGAIGMQMLFGRQGAINALFGTDIDFLGNPFHGAPAPFNLIDGRFLGVVIVEALHLYPIIYLNATAALANLDPALDEAAENLGAGPFKRFFRITLPLIRPGLFAGATIVFIWSFTELGTPLVFDFKDITPAQIFFGLTQVETSAQPYALTVILLAAAVGIYVVGRSIFGRRGHAMYSKASRSGGETTLTGPRGWAVTSAFALVTFLALLPHIGVILTAFTKPGQWYDSVLPTEWTAHNFQIALSGDMPFNAITMSLKLATMAVLLDIVIGILVAYLIVRTTIKGRGVLDALCMMPLAVPGLVLAFGYVAMTLRWPFGGGGAGGPLEGLVSVFGVAPNPIPLLVIAYAVRRLPYIVRATVAGLEQTSGELEEAAMNLGASRVTAVRKVILPLVTANIIAGALLAFSFAMLEVSDSLILAQQEQHFPITKAIYALLNRLGDGPYVASAMGVWGMALLAVTLVGASVMIGKKMGSIFRV